MEQGEVVFERLKRSEAYAPTAHETLKRDIFLKFWLKAASNLSKRFRSTGTRIDELGSEQNGFGFLIEEFAKLSHSVPKNSEEGEHFADLILHALRNGDSSFFPVNKAMSNPDILWVETSGKRVEITGMGEVKASVEAYMMKPEQLDLQEKTIRKLVELINIRGNAPDATSHWHKFARKRTIKIREPFRKIMIVPAGEKESFLKHLPTGWEVLELEFSYDEFVFIGQQIWPDFRKATSFGEGELGKFEKFLQTFLDFKKPRVKWLYKKANDESLPAEEIVMFAYATRRLPRNESDIAFIASAMNGWQKEFLVYPEIVLKDSDLTEAERAILPLLSAVPSDNGSEPLIFLSRLRIFSEKLLHNLKKRKDGSKKLLRQMEKCEELF